MFKKLPQLNIKGDSICVGCQYGKAHQLSSKESKFYNLFILMSLDTLCDGMRSYEHRSWVLGT